ncbi:ATPase, T2SS/T4P/T4SS family [Pseudomonas guariconensis]|uniref:GspE/PulE family protein n=1 Tax=Pseudomonas guariconensis TaxID=1288410 RepID=UPI003EE047E0
MSTKTQTRLWKFWNRPRRTSKEHEDASTNISKLVATVRKDARVKSRDDLPAYRGVITQAQGIMGNDLTSVAVLDLGNRALALLISESQLGQRLHTDLRSKLGMDQYRIQVERIADVSFIASINKAINKDSVDSRSSDVHPIVNELITDAVYESATDIHLCCRESSGMALFRVHGNLHPHRNYDVETCEQIAGYMFSQMADESSRSVGTFSLLNKSMSCMIRTVVGQTKYKLRFKYIRVADGWDVVIRLLPVETAGAKRKTFEDQGYAPSHSKLLSYAVARSIGFIALCGPTGAGKSSTLQVAMEADPHRRFRKRYGVEDPVEYKIFQVSQISVQHDDHEDEEESSKALNGTLMDILRADPDEIMIGETRNRSTAQVVTDFVLTGHKIYTTLHTTSAFGSIIRMARLGIDRHILADRGFLSVVAYQQLLPVLCNRCKVPSASVLTPEQLAVIRVRFKLNPDTIFCKSEDGCADCRKRGTVDLTVVAEIVRPDKQIRAYIAEGRDDEAELYWRRSRKTGFDDPDMTGKTAFEHALYKVSQGIIDPQDVERNFEPLDTYELVEVEL